MDNYKSILEVINEVDVLGDWRNLEEQKNYVLVLYKICKLYNGYSLKRGVKGYYSSDVFEAIKDICSEKFPIAEDVFDDKGQLREGLSREICYLGNYIASPYGLSLLCERTDFMTEAVLKYKLPITLNATEEGITNLERTAFEYIQSIHKKKKR